MGDALEYSNLSKSPKPNSVATGKKAYNKPLIASCPKGFARKSFKHLVSLSQRGFGSNALGHITFFLLKVAALETIRRLSRRRCPFVWQGLQALQILCYPPFKWIQKWSPFKGLIKSMQILSKPILFISVAAAFSDHSECRDENSDHTTDSPDSPDSEVYLEPSSVQDSLNESHCETEFKVLESENWLTQLNKELENQGITLPERINEDELCRFYAASNNDFSSFLSSIKKTIQWRETYRILSGEELDMWSNLLFWHGPDVMHRPCLIVRLGLACSKLASQDRPRFAQAVISQVEYGVLHLLDADNPQITVLVDCEGLSPLRVPMHMMRSCFSLLQDHFPNRLGCLFVIRLPAVVRVIAQTLIQVLKPTTRKKLKIGGDTYQQVLQDYLLILPSYLGGSCNCMKCSRMSILDMHPSNATRTSRIEGEMDISDGEDSLSLHPSDDLDVGMNGDYNHLVRTAIISILMVWVFIALIAVIHDPGSRYFPL